MRKAKLNDGINSLREWKAHCPAKSELERDKDENEARTTTSPNTYGPRTLAGWQCMLTMVGRFLRVTESCCIKRLSRPRDDPTVILRGRRLRGRWLISREVPQFAIVSCSQVRILFITCEQRP